MPPRILVPTLISSLSSVLGQSELSLPCDRQSLTCRQMPWPSHQFPGMDYRPFRKRKTDKGFNLPLSTAISISISSYSTLNLAGASRFTFLCTTVIMLVTAQTSSVAPTGCSFKSTPLQLTFTAQPSSVIYRYITKHLELNERKQQSCVILISLGSNWAQQGNVDIGSLVSLEAEGGWDWSHHEVFFTYTCGPWAGKTYRVGAEITPAPWASLSILCGPYMCSLQHGSFRIPRHFIRWVRTPRGMTQGGGPGRSSISFYDLASDVMQHHFHCKSARHKALSYPEQGN